MSANDPVKTAARTLDLFEAFARARTPLSLTELAQRINSPISSCHALVRTLQRRGYVYVLDHRKRVYPTKRLMVVAETIARHDPLLQRLLPILEELMQCTGETVLLGKRQGDCVTYLEVVEGRHTVRYAASPGDTKPLHSSAIGKAMLAELAPAELDTLLQRLDLTRVTDSTITTPDRLAKDIAESRARGWYETRGENVVDVMAIAVARPLLDETLGIAVAGPMARMQQYREAYLARLQETAAALERLGQEFGTL